MDKKHIGSTFDSFLAESGILEECRAEAIKKVSKYRAIKTVVDGNTFASKKEAARYQELKLYVRGGSITDLELQPSFELLPKYTTKDGVKVRALVYRSDFKYFDKVTGKTIVEDCKGMKTKEYLIKRKILLWRYPEINFIES